MASGYPKAGFNCVAPPDLIGVVRPVPDDVLGRPGRQAVTLLALAERNLGDNLFVDVFQRAVPFDHGALLVASRLCPRTVPSIGSIALLHAISRVQMQSAGARDDTLPNLDDSWNVLGMERLQPSLTEGCGRRQTDDLQPARPNLGDATVRFGEPGDLRVELYREAVMLLALSQREDHVLKTLVVLSGQFRDATVVVSDTHGYREHRHRSDNHDGRDLSHAERKAVG